jgi:hypothetical protein
MCVWSLVHHYRVSIELNCLKSQKFQQGTSEKDSTCISPFVHPNVHVITCSSFMWPEMHASTEEFTWFLYVRMPLVIASHNLFPRGQKDALTTLLIHAN